MKDQERLEGRGSITSDWYLKTGNEMRFKRVLRKIKATWKVQT